MHAMVIDEWGGPERCTRRRSSHRPSARTSCSIRNRAAGVNPVDTKIREGKLAGQRSRPASR